MTDAEAASRRLLSLNEALQRLSTYGQGVDAATQLHGDPLLRAAIERWLQIAIEACIDLAYQIIAAHGWTPPDTARGAFAQLAAHGVIAQDLATRMGRAAGMRNILVHEYAEVDLEVVALVLRDGLADLQQFAAIAGAKVGEIREYRA